MATKKKTAAAPVEDTAVEETTEATSSFGVQDLLDEIEKETGKAYQPATLRILLRKLAKEGTIEKSGGRWVFDGADSPEVEAIVDAVKNGRADKEETEDDEAPAEKPAKKAPAKKATRAKKAKVAEPEPEDDEDEDLEVDLEEL